MRLAVVVPYRDRAAHLREFVPAVSDHLQAAGMDHRIWVVEQADHKPFNRGRLLNVGYVMAVGRRNPEGYTHVVFHDVDMIPEEVAYGWWSAPTHLAGAASQFNYTQPYPEYFGGVTSFTCEQFFEVNGFNNDFWGWGCEDDDLRQRCLAKKLNIHHVPGRFLSLDHEPGMANEYSANYLRFLKQRAANEYDTNGLVNLKFDLAGAVTERAAVRMEPIVTAPLQMAADCATYGPFPYHYMHIPVTF